MVLVDRDFRKEWYQIKVIEVNLSFDNEWMFEDHQARVTNIESWDEYVSLYTFYSGEASGEDYKSTG